MEFLFSDEQLLIQQAASEIAQGELSPASEKVANDRDLFISNLKQLAELGFMGLNVDSDYGGMDYAREFIKESQQFGKSIAEF